MEVVLGPEASAWVPRRTFAVAQGGRLACEEAGESELVVAVAVSDPALWDLAAGRGWLAAEVEDIRALLVIEDRALPHARPAWTRGPRRALEERGMRFIPQKHDDLKLAREILTHTVGRDMEGVLVLITAGPTREHLDPVRFLSNPSTGRMGIALASVAARRGARVELCLGPTTELPPQGVGLHRFESAEELDLLVQTLGSEVDVVIAAAAVSDWRPIERAEQKVKKAEAARTLTFERTPDVLARLSARLKDAQARPLFIGFAAETEALEVNARKKLVGKGLDLVVANRVDGLEGAFASAEARITLVDAKGAEALPRLPKQVVAGSILDRIVLLLEASHD